MVTIEMISDNVGGHDRVAQLISHIHQPLIRPSTRCMSASEGGSCYTIPMTPWNAYPIRATIYRHSDVIVYDRLLVQKPDNVNHRTRLRSHPRSFDPPCMKLMMMFLLLHTAIIILAAPVGSDTARRASTAGSSVIMYVIPRPSRILKLTGICFPGRRELTRILHL